ncbi:hypothetical protein LIER_27429 [Lithospermum erythrorhizon]|uniref:Transposase MuDR plant domain-containing protein n=1 Tax=Lithospermum erythrorhizon TaxID=34254 RepID=A0AAV3RG42_LITER
MALRRTSGIVDPPVYDEVNEVGMLTLTFYHGRALLRSPYTRYVGGTVDYFDYVNGNSLTMEGLRGFVSDCRPLCDKDKTKFYLKLKENLYKGCRFLKLFVQHADLDSMLREEAINGEIRQDVVDDEDVGFESRNLGTIFMARNERMLVDYDSLSDGSSGSDDDDVLVDDEYDMEEDDALFDLHVDEGAEEGKASFNHIEFISQNIHDEINNVEGDRDFIGNGDGGFRSEHDSSDDDGHCKLDSFPKYNSKIDERNPRFAIGILFSCRVELKTAIDTLSIKDARDVKYIRNENKRVRVVCRDDECKWYIYARKLSGETGLQIRGCHLDHTCIPVYDNKTLKSSWLAKHYVKKFRNSPSLRAVDFRKEMNLKLGQHVSK